MRGPNLTAEATSSGNLAFARFPQRPHLHSRVRISVIVLILTGMSTTCRLSQRSDVRPVRLSPQSRASGKMSTISSGFSKRIRVAPG